MSLISWRWLGLSSDPFVEFPQQVHSTKANILPHFQSHVPVGAGSRRGAGTSRMAPAHAGAAPPATLITEPVHSLEWTKSYGNGHLAIKESLTGLQAACRVLVPQPLVSSAPQSWALHATTQ